MQPTTVQLWERIHAAGLATPDECRDWAIEIANSAGTSILSDSGLLAKELVQRGRITAYQANVLYRSLPYPIGLGPYRLNGSLEQRLGPNWFSADSRRSSDNAGPVWIYAVSLEQLQSPLFAQWPPSVSDIERHISLSHEHLDRWFDSGASMTHVFAVCDALPGESIGSRVASDSAMSLSESLRLVSSIARGLGRLHDVNLVHGNICTHSVWQTAERVILRRDPFFPPRSPYLADGPTCLANEQSWERFAYAAPELANRNATPTIASDLYAIGCLWLRMLTGKLPFLAGNTLDRIEWAELHARAVPSIPESVPSNIAKCINHLLAKNPSVRFPTTGALLEALDAASKKASSAKMDVSDRSNIAAVKPADDDLVLNAKREKSDRPTIPMPPKVAAEPPKPLLPAKMKSVEAPELAPPTTPLTAPNVIADSKPTVDLQPDVKEKQVAEPETQARSQTPLPKRDSQPAVLADSVQVPVGSELSTEPLSNPLVPVLNAPSIAQSSVPVKKKKKKKKTQAGNVKPKGKKRKKRPVWFLPAVIGVSALALILIGTVASQMGGLIRVDAGTNTTMSDAKRIGKDDSDKALEGKPQPVDPRAEFYTIGADDGKLLWVPPNAGSPFTLEMLPIGPEAIVFFSDRMWSETGIGKSITSWWSTLFPKLVSGWPERMVLNDVAFQQIAVAMYPGKQTGTMQHVMRFRLNVPQSADVLFASFEEVEKQKVKGSTETKPQTIWKNSKVAPGLGIVLDEFVGDPSTPVKQVVIGPIELMETMAEMQGKAGPLRRQLELLLQATDSRSDLTILAAPSFLYDDARDSINETTPFALPRLKEIIGDSVQAVSISTTLEPTWFIELRVLGNDLQSAGRRSVELKTRLKALPESIESQLVHSPADPYWRALANRMPQMLRTLDKYARFGAEDGQIIANAYLPSEAAANLSITSWMAINIVPTNKPQVASNTKTPTAATMKTAEQILDTPINLSVEQESLEVVLQLISNEVRDSVLGGVDGLPMVINGSAFQKEGITRNQQMRNFQHANVTVREILLNLVKRANPITTVKSPTEPDQKVVFVLIDDPSTPTKKRLELTTRAWVTANKAALPKDFVGTE